MKEKKYDLYFENSVKVKSLNDDYFKDNLDFEVPDLGAELTDEDKRYLYLKWGKGYTPDEWVRLEQLFNEMMQSYDI